MKKIRIRSIIIYFLIISFIVGLGFFVTKLIMNSYEWVINPINTHLSGSDLTNAGKILDRNGDILAESVDSKREYNANKHTREALLHTIGDGSINITTGIQNVFASQLFGYNIITGIGAPDFLNFSNDISLTLDSTVCKTAYEKMGNRKGAVCVYNYKTGELICMVSTPSYDPYDIPDIENDTSGKYEGAYLNRVLSSSFTPGSVFKVVTAVAAIENINDIDSRTFNCQGTLIVNGEKITCMEHHGNINLRDAMAKSCNIAFARMAMEMGRDKMTETANNLGFNSNFDIDSINVCQSFYNVENASEADLGWSGIGQQDDLVNPLHLTKIMGAIANEGIPVKPYMIKKMQNKIGVSSHIGKTVDDNRMLPTAVANQLKDIMRYTVKNYYGDSMFPGLNVCAKTGTAEVGNNKRPHAWISGFSTNQDTPLAFTVIVENSGYGRTEAGPIATAVMQAAANSIK